MSLLEVQIKTERLKLVPIHNKYSKDIYKSFNDDITEYMYPKPAGSIDETEDFIKFSINSLIDKTHMQLVIIDKITNDFIGCIGLHKCNTTTPEYGIWIKKGSHGNGYGKEAIHGLHKWTVENIDFDYILYPVDKRNIPSRKIPESLNGIITTEYEEINKSNKVLEIIEYRIYK